MSTIPESDSSVNDFLKTISLLGEKRNKEDDERARKLEADILQGRRERQARRAGLLLLWRMIRLLCADL